MNKRSTLALIVVASLAACSKGNDPAIQLVKSQPSETNGLTLGQVLDAKPNCSTKEWVSGKDKYERDVVTFRCKIALPQDRFSSAIESSTAAVRRQLTWITSTSCKGVDAQPLVVKHEQLTRDYFAKFSSVTEVLAYVVNQGQVVETHAGLNDANGAPVALNEMFIQFLPSHMEKPDDGPGELSALVRGLSDGWREHDLSCDQVRSALGMQPGSSAPQDSAAASQPEAAPQATPTPSNSEAAPGDGK